MSEQITDVPGAFTETKGKKEQKKPTVATGKLKYIKGKKQQDTLEALNKQPKKSLYIQAVDGQPPDFNVTINGVQFYIPCGKEVTVPEQVYQIIMERLESEKRLPPAAKELLDKANQV